MDNQDNIFFWTAAILYAASFAVALLSLPRRRDATRLIFHTFLIGGFLFQSFALYLRGVRGGAFPLGNEFEIIQVLGWSAVLLGLIIRPLFRLTLLSFFSSALATCICFSALLFPGWDRPVSYTGSGSPWIGFQTALAIFAYGVFGLLALTSLMYLIQHHGLERRKTGGIFALLPAIRQLEEMNSRLILLGVGILSVAVAIGFLNWSILPRSINSDQLLIATLVWFVYLCILLLRRSNRLFASPFARCCVVLFILTLISLWAQPPGGVRHSDGKTADNTLLRDGNR